MGRVGLGPGLIVVAAGHAVGGRHGAIYALNLNKGLERDGSRVLLINILISENVCMGRLHTYMYIVMVRPHL